MEKVNKAKEVAVHTGRRMVFHRSHWLVLVTCQESGVLQMCVMFILRKASGEIYIWLHSASLWARGERANYGKLAASRTSSKLWWESMERMRLNREKCGVIFFLILFYSSKRWVMNLLLYIFKCIGLLLMIYLFIVLVHCLTKQSQRYGVKIFNWHWLEGLREEKSSSFPPWIIFNVLKGLHCFFVLFLNNSKSLFIFLYFLRPHFLCGLVP